MLQFKKIILTLYVYITTNGAETPYPSGEPEFISGFCGVRVVQTLVICVVFCRSLLVLFHLVIIMSVLRSKASDYHFSIFKHPYRFYVKFNISDLTLQDRLICFLIKSE